MSATNDGETRILNQVFKNDAYDYSADATWYVSLHTGDPGEAGSQNTSEANYTSYARVAVTRASFSVTASGGVAWAFYTAAVTFPAATGGSSTVTYFGIGRSSTAAAAGTLLFKGACTNIAVSPGVTPSFGIDSLRITLD